MQFSLSILNVLGGSTTKLLIIYLDIISKFAWPLFYNIIGVALSISIVEHMLCFYANTKCPNGILMSIRIKIVTGGYIPATNDLSNWENQISCICSI